MFFAKNIKFLGHVVRKARTSPDLGKVKVMVEFHVHQHTNTFGIDRALPKLR
jgi:hypothetical protein